VTGLLRPTGLGVAMVALTLLVVVTVPLWLVVAAAASPLVPGRLRPLRLAWLLVLHLLLETAMLVAMLVLWLASGFGRAIRRPWF
jgi:hypothetical protein